MMKNDSAEVVEEPDDVETVEHGYRVLLIKPDDELCRVGESVPFKLLHGR